MGDAAVVVAGRVPAFVAGLAAILAEGGFEVARPPRLSPWIQQRATEVAVVAVHADEDLDQLRSLADEFPALLLVAVLPAEEDGWYVRALRRGAHAAVAWSSSPPEIVEAVRAARDGRTVLPTAVARSLARSSIDRPKGTPLLAREVHWLRVLAGGGSVVQLARAEGYSQREIFRRLSDVYRRMGARNRYEAIALAGQWGLLGGAGS
ncbi:LuxR C-terminal-related transcriptional regulator [Kutzneria kofuensis]|uniref:DNA-binding NarL/FixJ family response regulator n=1 Tax=Kutzneria kofuensis TaxID=103725 RepID=A0A7W9KPC6_9PSEU|nr:LuxR C-terminal-related transcriptional regulator [Kutzneria kofuensis]MBB5896263.1 DNA-binding NarL/FixJ family response regulator [Kutzneria kofuensis]